jgi:hypothetical protein
LWLAQELQLELEVMLPWLSLVKLAKRENKRLISEDRQRGQIIFSLPSLINSSNLALHWLH